MEKLESKYIIKKGNRYVSYADLDEIGGKILRVNDITISEREIKIFTHTEAEKVANELGIEAKIIELD